MLHGNILLVEDDIKIRSLLKRILSLENYNVFEAGDLKSAFIAISREDIHVIICDVMLPDGNGIEFTKEVKLKKHYSEIIILTAHANIPDAIEAIRSGAFDYLTKAEDNDKLLPMVCHAREKALLQAKLAQLKKQVGEFFSFSNIIGESVQIQETILLAKKVAASNTTVLLLGETGTGKELFARAIHSGSKKSNGTFVALNCSAFTRNLLESEIFGHKAGAFTGAMKDKTGLIEEANDGTLFLDEIGEMDIELQAKLLRVLESNEFIKVGDTKTTKVDVRVIAATNRNLEEYVAQGKFREDLFYRLNVFSVYIPPLRERKADIPELADYFLKIFSKKSEHPINGMSLDFVSQLEKHEWPGNIRELKNVIERAVILSSGNKLTVDSLPHEFGNAKFSLPPDKSFNLALAEKNHIKRALQFTRGNKVEAAKLLCIGLTTLYRKIQEYSLYPEFNYEDDRDNYFK